MTGSDEDKASSTELTLKSDLSTPWKPPVENLKKPAGKIPSALPAEGIPGFDLGRVLGKGGMGLVVAGTRRADGLPVAIKLLRADMTSDAEFRERFHREVEVMKEVRHQNVVGIVDSGDFQGWLWLALELMPDGDLERYLRPRGQLFEKDALTFTIKIARGLAAVHAAGLLHRDIKPQNIFLHHKATDGGDVKVGDLGMARHASGDDRMTMTGTACGTPAYMAPEQIRGLADLDARVDVYALGVLLYTLLAGKEPFYGDTVYTITHAVLNDPVPDLRRANPNVSATVVAIIRKSMAKDRQQRYASMVDMQRDLEAVAQGARPVHIGVVTEEPVASSNRTPPGARPVATGGGGGGGGFSIPGLGLIVRVLMITAVIVVPLTLLPKLLEKRVSGDAPPGTSTGAKVAPGQDANGSFSTIRAAGQTFTVRWCPPGEFTMGSPMDESSRAAWESTHHVRFTAGCWMLESEVTQAQFQAIVGSNPSVHVGSGLPVDNLTVAEAENFLSKLNQRLGSLNARLPSEAEWEYACRAGRITSFSTSPADEALLSDRDLLAAWDMQPLDAPPNWKALESALRGLPSTAVRPAPRPTSEGRPNPWGLADMHGNVQEWCRDRWDYRSSYLSAAAVDPVANAGVLAVVRGGSWIHPPSRGRSACRHAQDPDQGAAWIGFRFVIPGGMSPAPLPTER